MNKKINFDPYVFSKKDVNDFARETFEKEKTFTEILLPAKK